MGEAIDLRRPAAGPSVSRSTLSLSSLCSFHGADQPSIEPGPLDERQNAGLDGKVGIAAPGRRQAPVERFVVVHCQPNLTKAVAAAHAAQSGGMGRVWLDAIAVAHKSSRSEARGDSSPLRFSAIAELFAKAGSDDAATPALRPAHPDSIRLHSLDLGVQDAPVDRQV